LGSGRVARGQFLAFGPHAAGFAEYIDGTVTGDVRIVIDVGKPCADQRSAAVDRHRRSEVEVVGARWPVARDELLGLRPIRTRAVEYVGRALVAVAVHAGAVRTDDRGVAVECHEQTEQVARRGVARGQLRGLAPDAARARENVDLARARRGAGGSDMAGREQGVAVD